MRTIRVLGATAVLAATALVAPGAASADQPTTYSGEFTGAIQYNGCNAQMPTDNQAGGTWSVRLYGDTAKGKFLITVNGVKHVFYPYPGLSVDSYSDGGFTVSDPTDAGLLTVTLVGDTLTYTVGTGEPGSYTFGDLVCSSVTYPGTLTE